ncbi:sugar ABC transporter ATP-binding protein [Sphaerimonospora cavernae]|uniref:Sugar ABC transporter ATP-binding protein n=1 Tax=Sphaerimonospora cavernae TaxID=1740611 RepID=A0ABV6TZI1_9ACTN
MRTAFGVTSRPQPSPDAGDAPPVLSLRGLGRSFPGVRALDGVTVDFLAGQIHALLGENGAGKSTLLKILSGVQPQSEGQILVDGVERAFGAPRDADALGITMVHQELSIVPQLSIAKNVVLGREPSRFGVMSIDIIEREAAAALAKLGWHGDVTRKAGDVGVATQQLVEIARAIYRDQRVIILDEPTASLGPHEVEPLLAVLRGLRDEGRCLIYVSHRLAELEPLGVDAITVLRDGQLTGTFNRSMGWTEADLVRSMVGRSVEVQPRQPREPGPAVLELHRLQPSDGEPVDLAVRAGELVCIAGMVGSGRTELLQAVFGADPGAAGTVTVAGRTVPPRSPRHAIRAGIAFLTEDRKGQGLAMNLDLAGNVTLIEPPRRAGVLNMKKRRAETADRVAEVGLRRKPDVAVKNLSGGNQQKAVIARWRRTNSKVYLFDEPTRGVDVGAKDEIYRLMESLLESGAALLVVSSEMPEVLALADRVLVMRGHAVVAELSGQDVTEEQILAHATGSTT